MSPLVRRFEDLDAWQMAMELAVSVYEVSAVGPLARDFALRDQLRKSAISIFSNVAEGFERNSRPDFRRFLVIAKASCGELRSQIHLAQRLEYISSEMHNTIVEAAERVSNKLGGLRASIEPK